MDQFWVKMAKNRAKMDQLWVKMAKIELKWTNFDKNGSILSQND